MAARQEALAAVLFAHVDLFDIIRLAIFADICDVDKLSLVLLTVIFRKLAQEAMDEESITRIVKFTESSTTALSAPRMAARHPGMPL